MVAAELQAWEATLVGGTRLDLCEARHGSHATRRVETEPLGWLTTFDWERYENTPGYCSGDDEVSKALTINGTWERNETAVVLQLLRTLRDGVVIDFGAHLGWYTLLAAVTGHRVVSVDADEEHLRLLHANVSTRGFNSLITPVLGWVDAATRPLEPLLPVALVKADIEGLEHEAVRVIEPLLASGRVHAVLLELSPVFGSEWERAVEQLTQHGYRGWLIPDMPCENPAYDTWTTAATSTILRDQPQRSVIFVREHA